MDVIDFAAKVKQKYSDIRNTEHVAVTENILLMVMEMSSNIEGFACFLNGKSIIVINKGLAKTKQVEVFWHEYYHIYFSVGNYEIAKMCLQGIKTCENRDEKKADLFASLILIDELPAECDVYTLMDDFGVSQHIAEVRIRMMQLV